MLQLGGKITPPGVYQVSVLVRDKILMTIPMFSGLHVLAVSVSTFTGVFYPEIQNGSRKPEMILVLPALLMFECC